MSKIYISEAIKDINPNAEFVIRANDINQITWNNGTTPITKAEIEAKMAELPTEEEEKAIREEEAIQKEADKSSGKQKLKDLGLTDAEIKALTGA